MLSAVAQVRCASLHRPPGVFYRVHDFESTWVSRFNGAHVINCCGPGGALAGSVFSASATPFCGLRGPSRRSSVSCDPSLSSRRDAMRLRSETAIAFA